MGFAQQSLTQVKAKFIDQPITVDGVLDEDIWQEISPVSDFWQYFPADSIKAEYQTSIQIAYDLMNRLMVCTMKIWNLLSHGARQKV